MLAQSFAAPILPWAISDMSLLYLQKCSVSKANLFTKQLVKVDTKSSSSFPACIFMPKIQILYLAETSWSAQTDRATHFLWFCENLKKSQCAAISVSGSSAELWNFFKSDMKWTNFHQIGSFLLMCRHYNSVILSYDWELGGVFLSWSDFPQIFFECRIFSNIRWHRFQNCSFQTWGSPYI